MSLKKHVLVFWTQLVQNPTVLHATWWEFFLGVSRSFLNSSGTKITSKNSKKTKIQILLKIFIFYYFSYFCQVLLGFARLCQALLASRQRKIKEKPRKTKKIQEHPKVLLGFCQVLLGFCQVFARFCQVLLGFQIDSTS